MHLVHVSVLWRKENILEVVSSIVYYTGAVTNTVQN